jgi:hypothetical protein
MGICEGRVPYVLVGIKVVGAGEACVAGLLRLVAGAAGRHREC